MSPLGALAGDEFVAVLIGALIVVSALVIWLMGRGLSSWRDNLGGVDEGLLAREGRTDPADAEELREEVRSLVVAENARRLRRGAEPLPVEAEVERRLREHGVWI